MRHTARVAGSTLFLVLSTLLATSAPAQTVSVLANIAPGLGNSNPSHLFAAGSDLCFMAHEVFGFTQLWCSNGTEAGTRSVTDTLPGSHFIGVTDVAAVGGTRFVSGGRAGSIGFELYAVSDADVAIAIDIHPTNSSTPQNFFSFGNILLFSADDGVNGRELWRSDGTLAGTFMVADLNPGAGSSNPEEFALVDGEVYFGAVDGPGGVELFRTDGTNAGTQLVADLPAAASPTGVRDIVDLFGTAIFSTVFGAGLNRSEGTPASTLSITSFSSVPSDLTVHEGLVIFAAAGNVGGGVELWRSDGSAAGTSLVKDVHSGVFGSVPRSFEALGEVLFFAAQSTLSADVELWRTQGSELTTERVLDINPAGLDEVSDLRALGNTLYFAASDGMTGIELWQSDGTAGGTHLAADLAVPGSSLPRDLTVFDGRLYFTATSTQYGKEVFVLEPPAVPGLPVAGQVLLLAMLGCVAALGITARRVEIEALRSSRDPGRSAPGRGRFGGCSVPG